MTGKIIEKKFAADFGNNNNNLIISRDNAFLTVRCVFRREKTKVLCAPNKPRTKGTRKEQRTSETRSLRLWRAA